MKDKDKDRGTGRTTRQMVNAPKGAIYIWPHFESLFYPQDLAKTLGREDLTIIPASHLHDPHRFAGKHHSGVILDHAVKLTPKLESGYEYVCALVRR